MQEMTPDWKALRAEFPALSNWTYLNTATYGQMPRSAADAMSRHLARRDELACGDYLGWFDDMDANRESCARLVHCKAPDIAFVINASTGLAALVLGLPWQSGDEVLTLDDEFPNQLYVSAVLARFGAGLQTVAWPEFYRSVNERTRLVVLSTVNYATGFRPPLEEVSRFLRERGVLLYVDGSQSVGALQFDIELVRPSVLCVDAYKWMLSANGDCGYRKFPGPGESITFTLLLNNVKQPLQPFFASRVNEALRFWRVSPRILGENAQVPLLAARSGFA
jgi:cysteine desulfurase / selenocysteine lyase